MATLVAILGVAIAALGIIGMVNPATLMRFVAAAFRSQRQVYLIVAFRLTLGVLLVAAAPQCRFPMVVWCLGILSILSAVTVLLLGFERLRPFIDWWLSRPGGIVRAWSFIAMAFGIFLLYAAL